MELTEIEAHLRIVNNTVETAVPMVHPNGKSMLAAFITSQSGFGPEFARPFRATPKDKVSMVSLAAQMSQEMSRKLHYYMIPSVFLPLPYAIDGIGEDGPSNDLYIR